MILYKLTPESRIDLLAIRDYIFPYNPAAAERVIREIKDKCQFLGEHPRLIKPQARYRNLAKHNVGNYLIFFRPHKSGVEIIRVIHGAQDIEAILLKLN